MQDDQNQKSNMTFRQFIKKSVDIYKPFKGVVMILFVFLIAIEGLNMIQPYIYGRIIDGLFAQKELSYILKMLLSAFGIYLISNIFLSYIREVIELKKLEFDTKRHINKKTMEKIMSFSIGQHENQNSGIKKSVIDKGQHSLETLIFTLIYDVLPIILHNTIVVIVLLFLAPILGVIIFGGAVVFVAMVLYVNNKFKDDIKKDDDMYHDNSKMHNEILRNTSLVKINNKENKVINEYDLNLKNSNDFSKKLWIKLTGYSTARNFFIIFTKYLVMLVGVYLVYEKVYTPGFLVMFWAWSNTAFNNFGRLSNLYRRLIGMYAAVKSYFILLDVESDVKESENPIKLEKIKGDIEFNNIYFKYPVRKYIEDKKDGEKEMKPKEAKNILSGVNIKINSGQKVAIVGPSGAGKSTLVHLILRAYDPNNGSILIDGYDLRDIDLGLFRSSIGFVPQDIALFDETLKYNIAFGVHDRELSDEDLENAAKMACIDKFIHKLEKGFDTIIGERGVRLSGGERQRVGIARALIKNPSILIFDEATSSLDTENEALIRESIEKASKGRTTIIIAHRLSTIKDADKIIVMEHGKIVGEGKHDELLQTCEAYQRLINNQTVMVGSA